MGYPMKIMENDLMWHILLRHQVICRRLYGHTILYHREWITTTSSAAAGWLHRPSLGGSVDIFVLDGTASVFLHTIQKVIYRPSACHAHQAKLKKKKRQRRNQLGRRVFLKRRLSHFPVWMWRTVAFSTKRILKKTPVIVLWRWKDAE